MNIEKNKAGKGYKERVNKVRRILWYYFIERRLSAHSAYEVEGLLDINAFYRNEYGELSNKNKWIRYKNGNVSPNKSLLLSVEKKLPGSSHIFNHVLWTILQNKTTLSYERCLTQLAPDIQRLVFQKGNLSFLSEVRRSAVTDKKLQAIERRANIDALACITILLLESLENKNSKLTLSLARSLFRVLLVLCASLPWQFCQSDLFIIFRENVFSRIASDEYRIQLDEYDFNNSIELLKQSLFHIEDNLLFGSEKYDPNKIMLDVLCGKYGLQMSSTLRLPLGFEKAT